VTLTLRPEYGSWSEGAFIRLCSVSYEVVGGGGSKLCELV
jgi:hypothetical protein